MKEEVAALEVKWAGQPAHVKVMAGAFVPLLFAVLRKMAIEIDNLKGVTRG